MQMTMLILSAVTSMDTGIQFHQISSVIKLPLESARGAKRQDTVC